MVTAPQLRLVASMPEAPEAPRTPRTFSVVDGRGGLNPLHLSAPGRVDDILRMPDPDRASAMWHKALSRLLARYADFPRILGPRDSSPTINVAKWSGFPRHFDCRLDTGHHPERMGRAHRSAEMLSRFVPAVFRTLDGDIPVRLPAHFAGGIALYPEVDGVRDQSSPFDVAQRPQDEFLEWHTVRDALGRVIRIDVTCELPDYWQALANTGIGEVAELYGELLKTHVAKDDLVHKGRVFRPVVERGLSGLRVACYELMPGVDDGAYDPLNRWNTAVGAVHMTHRSNTMDALLGVVALASQDLVGVVSDGVAFAAALTAAGGFGDANRHSDPAIGAAVQGLVGAGKAVGLVDPVGVYVSDIDLSDFRDPTGARVAPEEVLTIERGRQSDINGLSHVVRFSIRPPAGVEYGLESCSINGHPLSSGGAVARATTLSVHLASRDSNAENMTVASRASLVAHPTRMPPQFMTIPHGNVLPDAEDPRWDDGAQLAPEMGAIMRAVQAAELSSRQL